MKRSCKYLPVLMFLFVVGLMSNTAFAGDEPPAWLRNAAATVVPGYDKEVPGVVLLDERTTTVGSDGKMTITENYVYRVLTREGRKLAIARAFYLVDSGKVRDIEGWIIRRDGTTKTYDKKSVLDIIADKDDVYNEGRIKIIDASDDVDTGYVFGYTAVSEESPLFYQDVWEFQNRLPTMSSRYTLNLPDSWTATSITFNTAEVKPRINGSSYTWEMGNLAPVPPEPMSPATANLSPRIVVNYSPGGGQSANRTFTTWADVSRWATALHDPQVTVDDNVAAKARELTANSKTEIEKIRAIGAFVQNLQYISIDIGVGHGNGYKPRPASLVLSRGYGDCKDKANLMRALLRSLRIEAYPIAIYSGDPAFVRQQWPSPLQFNHCIIAVKVSAETVGPTVIEDEKLGRLLIFDATDPYTPVGDLPDYLQGSLALIGAGDQGGLVRMPVTPPDTDRLERDITATIGITGDIQGKITEHAKGQTSSLFRREVRGLSTDDYRKSIEGWLTRGVTGAQLLNITTTDRDDRSGFDLDVDFKAVGYAQLMQGRLLVFKPVIVGRRNNVYLTELKRVNPVEMDASAVRETAVFALPAGFTVDETPDAVNLETSFGKYTTRFDVKGDKLVFTRSLTTNRVTIPVEKYDSVRAFFSKIRDAEQTPVVLIKK